jgi:tetratricopeptide (TPR) repeat protein
MRLPFQFQAHGGVGRLALSDLALGLFTVDHLELEVTDLGTDPGVTNAERFQRRRTRLRRLTVRAPAASLDQRVESVRRQLAALGITQIAARLCDGYISVRARAADGLAAADLTFRIQVVHAGTHLRMLASTIRVHGHLPTPAPLLADRILTALAGAADVANLTERPHARGLCDVEIDLVGALLWHIMPRAGWRLPATSEVELAHVRIAKTAIEIAYGPSGSRGGDIGVRPQALQLAGAHDLMHSADQQLRSGHIEEAMRGYRALLAAGGPDQPHLIDRILALASSRPAWFFDGLELARQALGRPGISTAAAHGALASITLAQGDAREAASHLTHLANRASAEGDDDQAALAALAGARLLRVLDPKAATQLYELALQHDPSSTEAADALADRLTDEQRWPELVRLLRSRVGTADASHGVQLHLRLADVFVHHMGDLPGAQQELEAARALAPEDPAVHEMTATILTSREPSAATAAWREVARLAEARGDRATAARAYATLGSLLSGPDAERAWERALELDAMQSDAIAGLAYGAAARDDHAAAVEYFERLRGLGLTQSIAARHELALARSLVAQERLDDARGSLRRATLAGGETAAEAHAVLAEIAEAASDREHAAAELDTAISSLVELTGTDVAENDRLYTRAAELAMSRAILFDQGGHAEQASADWERAHDLAHDHAPDLARDAARTMLSRAPDPTNERRWIDAVLATRPPPAERAALLVQRADTRRRERSPDLAAALADLHEALSLTDEDDATAARTRRQAYQLEAEILAHSGDQRARAQALAALARMADRASDRVEHETAAAAAWLAADEPAAALPHGARAHAALVPEIPLAMRREVLTTLGEAAWRQRAWLDVIRAYKALVEDPPDPAKLGTYRYRLAVAADRTGDAALALATLRPLVEQPEGGGGSSEARGPALRMFADLAERAGDLGGAAAALEGFAAVASETTPSARADAMYRAGELFRRADRGDDAVRCLEAALKISDTHLPALDALEHAWRERGDTERVAVILGRKVAATARHPHRQKPLLSRLGDLQEQLGRPDVALETHKRALEIDASWRPSLRYVTDRQRADGDMPAAAAGFAQLAGELASDAGIDVAILVRERQLAAKALADLVTSVDDAQLESIRAIARPALERASVEGGELRPASSATESRRGPIDNTEVAAALARVRGEPPPRPTSASSTADELTPSGRMKDAPQGALSLQQAALRARAAGKLADAYASLEAANHVSPGSPDVLRELVELATELGDHAGAARHLAALAETQRGGRKGDALLALADLYYDKLEDTALARKAMRDAADAFGGTRGDTTLRLLAAEAATHLAWDVAVDALSTIVAGRRTTSDVTQLAIALERAGKLGEAVKLVENATAEGKFDDGGRLLAELSKEVHRKAEIAWNLEQRAKQVATPDATAMRTEADALWAAIGRSEHQPPVREADEAAVTNRLASSSRLEKRTDPPSNVLRLPAHPDTRSRTVGEAAVSAEHLAIQTDAVASALRIPADSPAATQHFPALSDEAAAQPDPATTLPMPKMDASSDDDERRTGRLPAQSPPEEDSRRTNQIEAAAEPPSVIVTGTPEETATAVALAAASANRDQLVRAFRDTPDDPAVLLALLAHLGDREPALRREVLDQVAEQGSGRAQAIALHELALIARSQTHEPIRAAALWTKAHRVDPSYPPVWMPLADALVDADDIDQARRLYEQIAGSSEYDAERRSFAADRARTLGRDDSVVSGEIRQRMRPPTPSGNLHPDLVRATELAEKSDWTGAITAAERASAATPGDTAALELLEKVYFEAGQISAASEAIGRQLVLTEDPVERATLWRRRAKLYRDALGRDAEAYRCLKEAHACSPADPEVAYQLRTAAMVRGEWALAASLLYREIAAAANPRDRGALHLELAMIYDERLDDPGQAQVNYEQALAFDPSIPAAKAPLARRYEAVGKLSEAARLYEEATTGARAADRLGLLAAARRCREAAEDAKKQNPLADQLDREQAAGNTERAIELAHQLWRAQPGDAAAFRILANAHRTAGDLVALTELTTIRASRADEPEERAAAWLEVARLADEAGQLDQAARAYDLALIEDPGHVGALDARGALAFRLHDWATADLIYRDLSPGESVLGDDELALRRSLIAEHLGRDGEALNQALIASQVAPGRRDLLMRVQNLATRVGDLASALSAARAVLDLVPLDDDEMLLAQQFTLVELQREAGDADAAIAQLERIVRDHPMHRGALEQLADLHVARGDWQTATRYLYQLVPLAPTPTERAERLYRLGEAVLVHLGDIDRADDVFLRASDLDPSHIPTLRRLLDVYWRADDPAALVEVASELAASGALTGPGNSLAQALVAAALIGDTPLAQKLVQAMGDEAPRRVASALGELSGRGGRIQITSASTAVAELGKRGVLDLHQVRAAASGTPVASLLDA